MSEIQGKINKTFFRVMDGPMKNQFIGFLLKEKIPLKEIMKVFEISPTELKGYGYNIDGSRVIKDKGDE